MAQAGYTPIQLYHSTTPAAAPTAGNLIAGELAINTADGILYYEDSGGLVKKIAQTVTPVANGGTGATTLTGVVKGNGTSAFTAGMVALGSEVSGTLPVANGGTGATTLTANNVILGNGTSAPLFVAPGTNGNVLTSNGTTWQSTTPAASGASKGQAIAFSLIFGL